MIRPWIPQHEAQRAAARIAELEAENARKTVRLIAFEGGARAAARIAELEAELDRRLDEIKTAATVNETLEAERDRLREALEKP